MTNGDERTTPRLSRLGLSHVVAAVALAMSAYHYLVGYVGEPIAQFHRPIHLFFVLSIIFLGGMAARRPHGPDAQAGPRRNVGRRIWNGLLLAVTVASTGFLVFNAEYVSSRISFVTPLSLTEYVLGIGLVLVVLEAVRRTIGWPLVVITSAFLLYAKFGNLLPYPFWHRGYSVGRIVEQSYLGLDGIWGVPLGVTASYVFLFVLFGTVLLASGGGEFFTKLATRVTRGMKGGPAKGSIVASTLMGMLTGSSAANAVTTGSFTIPVMRKAGYEKNFAAGVEAASSANGQVTPPIMGAAAFIMIEFTGIPYVEILKAALIPALLCFFAVFIMVDLEARRLNLSSYAASDGGSSWALIRSKGYLFIPLILLIVLLFQGYTPATAAFWTITSLLGSLLVFDGENRGRMLHVVREAFEKAPKLIASITVACASAGIIVGVVHMTGIGLKISSIVLSVSQGSLLLLLLLTMIVAIVLGMGMPTSAAYVILAALLAPGIIEYGVPVIAAHMFVMFGASKSAITPPVAIASYAAAAVAGADPWKTSIIAFRLALTVFIIPYMFVFGPALLGIGNLVSVTFAIVTATAGIFMLSASVIGWLRTRLRWWQRLVAASAALTLMNPGSWTDLAGLGLGAVAVATTYVLDSNKPRIANTEGEHA